MRPAPERGALPTALWLLGAGFWPIPISARNDPLAGNPGKSPIGRGWGAEKPNREKLRAVYDRCPGAGVGMAIGPASGIIHVDVDEPNAAAPVLARLDLPATLGWQSARGEHRVYFWSDRVRRVTDKAVVYFAGGAIELRLGANGKQFAAVCPPSVGTDGRSRRWNRVWKVAPFPECVLGEIERTKTPLAPRTVVAEADHSARYALSALRGEVALVRGAAVGSRNATLNRAAFKIGQLVGAGFIDRAVVENELFAGATDAGLEGPEVASTIRSGLEAGMKKPRKPMPTG